MSYQLYGFLYFLLGRKSVGCLTFYFILRPSLSGPWREQHYLIKKHHRILAVHKSILRNADSFQTPGEVGVMVKARLDPNKAHCELYLSLTGRAAGLEVKVRKEVREPARSTPLHCLSICPALDRDLQLPAPPAPHYTVT